MSRAIFRSGVFVGLLLAGKGVLAQEPVPSPLGQAGVSCTASAVNRNVPVEPTGAFYVTAIPGGTGAFRARVTCSDGTVGQTRLGFTDPAQSITVDLGDIVWGRLDPAPAALGLGAPRDRLTTGETSQLQATAIALDGTTRDVTPRAEGTSYSVSNELLASVTENGLVTVRPVFAPGSSSRVVVSAVHEGGVAGSYVFLLGPRGSLQGRVLGADGATPVAGARVSVLRAQPRGQAGTVTTDASGGFRLEDVSAGSFSLSVIDPATGDRGQAVSTIEAEGETATVDVRLNGLGTILVTVVDGGGAPVPGVSVTATSLTAFRATLTALTDTAGQATFAGFPAGAFTVSARDARTGLLGTTAGRLPVAGTEAVTLPLEAAGAIGGLVLGGDGSAAAGAQIRLVSSVRGLVSQRVTGPDGRFRFEPVSLGDGPYTLDAMLDGRLRARRPGLILSAPGQELALEVRLGPVGVVAGLVSSPEGAPAPGVDVTLQSAGDLHPFFRTKTDAGGRYRFEAVPVGTFDVAASGAGGATARATGSVGVDGDVVAVDLRLLSNGVVGTVYGRDGVAPVGAGVTVTLSPGSRTTTTDAQGAYGFSIATPAVYTIEAADGLGNRGRTQVVVTTIDPTHPLVANLAFLGRGSVAGQVRDASGTEQAGVVVTLTSESVFGGSSTATTDAAGRYAIASVFVGDLTVSARNPVTQLAGITRTRLLGDGQSVTADITLAATGSVQGRVLRSDGVTPLHGAQVEIRSGGSTLDRTTAGADGAYRFNAVPLGDLTLFASEPLTGDRGLAYTRLAALNEVRTVDVRLLGQGAVRVLVVDEGAAAVGGAVVTLTSGSVFGGTQTSTTGPDGILLFQPVFNGDFTVSATKAVPPGQLSGSASGTVVRGGTAEVTVLMTSRPLGRIEGTVFAPDTVTPRAGVRVRLQPGNRSTTTRPDGLYAFENVEGGTVYNVDGLVNERVRARAPGVQISSSGEVVRRDLTLIGVGSVSGRVLSAQGDPQPGIAVRLRNPDPVYGGTFDATSGGDGGYALVEVPAGDFTITATNAASTRRAEDRGRIGFDGATVSLDLILVDNAVSLPRTLYDANNFPFDLAGDGSVGQGGFSVFRGGSGADIAAGRLDVVVGGTPIPFRNGDGTIGRLAQSGQLVEVDELNASGLHVTRRMYVPKTGTFARYVEVLENPTSAPVTVDLRVTTHFRESVGAGRVVDSSDGDGVLAAGTDRWVVIDDERDSDPFRNPSSVPAVAVVFDGEGATDAVDEAGIRLVGQVAKVELGWDAVTVGPGARVAFMHFLVQQLDRRVAREAALRLVRLPPEAMEGLTPEERSIIRNFALPADGSSVLDPLPPVDVARVEGRVFSGDGTTPIAGARVQLQSDHPLYGRVYQAFADAEGAFRFTASATGNGQSVAIPTDDFRLSAVHPTTSAATAVTAGRFEAGATVAVQDLILLGTGNVRGRVTRHTGAVVPSGTVQTYLPDGRFLSVGMDATGSYLYTGLPPGNYTFTARQPHPQGTGVAGSAAALVASASTTVVDIQLAETGEVTGLVHTANGEPAVGASVQLDPGPPAYRSTQTDTAGRYRFTDVATGAHSVVATDPTTGATASAAVEVQKDATATADLTLAGFGTVVVQVNFQRGTGAPGSLVTSGNRSQSTDTSGRASFSVPLGPFPATARHPENSQLTTSGQTDLATNGGTVGLTLTLPGAASIAGTVFRPDGSTPAASVPVTVRRVDLTGQAPRVVSTNAQGAYRVAGLPLGPYTVSAADLPTAKFADAEALLAEDGQERRVDLTLQDNRIPLPATLFDANNFPFDVQPDGSVAAGKQQYESSYYPGVFASGAAGLEIDGVPFTGESSAFLEASRRQLVIRESGLPGGLRVTRKVYLPRAGYFARYLDVLENPSGEPLSVAVTLRTRLRVSDLRRTSSGDVLAPDDSWATFDDATDADPFLDRVTMPSTAHVLGSASGRSSLLLVAGPSSSRELVASWEDLVIPAGGKVALLHFTVQQVTRAASRAAAERLVQMPPEALEFLTDEERAAVLNFVPPAESPVPPLPALTGALAGRVLEGDATTPVRDALVLVESLHPLFGRTWLYTPYYGPCGQVTLASLRSTAQGTWSLAGRLQEGQSIPLPLDAPVRVKVADLGCAATRGHPLTNLASATYLPSFAGGASTITQDVLFPSGIVTGTVVGRPDYGVTSGSVTVTLAGGSSRSVTIGGDATYRIPGLAEGSYDLRASVSHIQGTGLTGLRPAVPVTLGQTTVADIPLQPTGAVNGTVVTASGAPAIDSSVLISAAGVSRSTRTDSLGRFSLTAVPVGSYAVTVTDRRNGAQTPASVSVAENETAVLNVTLVGTGTVQLLVTFARGAAAPDAPVRLRADAIPGEKSVGRTDSGGRINVSVPVGNFTLRVDHPALSGLQSTASGAIGQEGDVLPLTVALKALARLRLTVVDQDAGSAPVTGAVVELVDSLFGRRTVGTTNAAGQLDVPSLPEGAYTASARSPVTGLGASASGVVDATSDGTTIERTLALSSAFERTGVLTFSGERHLYSIEATAGDVLGVRVNGVPIGTKPATYLTRIYLYGPDGTPLARGYAYSLSAGGQQYDEFGRLLATPAPASGFYTVAVESYYDLVGYYGGYRASATRNATVAAVQPFQGGGSVVGTVLRADGATPAPSRTLRLRTEDVLGLHVGATTDALGRFAFSGVPIAPFRLMVLDSQDPGLRVEATGAVSTLDEVVSRDVVLPPLVQLEITVRQPGGTPLGAGVAVDVTGTTGSRRLYTNSSGLASAPAYGETLTVTAYHPSNDQVQASAQVTGLDGATVGVDLTFAVASASGRVLYASGARAPYLGVLVVRAAGGTDVASAYTDANGAFSLPALPAGEALLLRVSHPAHGLTTEVAFDLASGESRAGIEFVLVGEGEVRGRVENAHGAPLPYTYVEATYLFDEGYSTSRAAYTDANGEYRITGLPVGRLLTVRATVWGGIVPLTAETTATLTADGESLLLPLLVIEAGTTLRIAVRDAEGEAPLGREYPIYGETAALGRLYLGTWSSYEGIADVVVSGIPAGPIRVTAFDYDVYRDVAGADILVDASEGEVPVTLVLSKVRGTVRFPNGTPVDGPYVRVTQTLPDGDVTFYASEAGADGSYAVLGPQPGDFTLVAEDPASGLQRQVSGQLASPGELLTIDVTLPFSGTVTGILRDRSGAPVPGASVYVRSSAIDLTRYATTDDQGAYRVDRVATGLVTAYGQDPVTGLPASSSGVLASEGETIVLDLQPPAPGSLVGRVLAPDGATPSPDATVSAESVSSFGPLGTFARSTVADVDGRYALADLPAGAFRLTASSTDGLMGRGEATVAADADTVADVVLGNAAALPYNLDGADGFRYDVSCGGQLGDGGTADGQLYDAYDGTYSLTVANQSLPCTDVAALAEGGRELVLGPFDLDGLRLSRRVFVPADGGYARYLETVQNMGTTELTVPVAVTGNLGSDGDTRVVADVTSGGGRYVVTDDARLSDPTLAHVLGGPGGRLSLAASAFVTGNDEIGFSWNVTLPPGETVRLLHFAVQRAPGATEAASEQAEALAAGTDPAMFDGMTAEDRASVVNFAIP